MNFISTRNSKDSVSFKKALENGLCPLGGLYVPENIPKLKPTLFKQIDALKRCDLAVEILLPFVKNDIPRSDLKKILKDSINFPTPLIELEDNQLVLELFHGPTQAFKDVGARFMSRCLSYFSKKNKKDITILVATSGDTGSAVAQGFYKVPNTQVKILFPKDKVSAYQQHQMTTLGHNIEAIEIDGSFDDCQALVKQAFLDSIINEKLCLSSANSINIARLLPQMIYYFLAYQQLSVEQRKKDLVVSVPSGNLGNLTAGVIAQKMGLPIKRFVAAQNANNTLEKYQKSGVYQPQKSVATYSNAMDVGAPSNFERLQFIYKNEASKMGEAILSAHFSDEQTLETIQDSASKSNYILDPHGAVAKLGLDQYLKENELGILLETASPQKFEGVMKKALPTFNSPSIDNQNEQKNHLPNDYNIFKAHLLN